jgi:mRNA-degrading endonuclease RelE of RelBE toxin-antitoxin system
MRELDHRVAQGAFTLIEEVIAKDPYSGEKRKGKYSGLSSFRFSDYRIISEIREKKLLVVVLRIRHRKNVHDGL